MGSKGRQGPRVASSLPGSPQAPAAIDICNLSSLGAPLMAGGRPEGPGAPQR